MLYLGHWRKARSIAYWLASLFGCAEIGEVVEFYATISRLCVGKVCGVVRAPPGLGQDGNFQEISGYG
ncbi:hypothetical protein A9Q90_07260 [Gammaproteobacteria bacterium 54_18_T64]|nr:hypothetical protein A9Q90_07260 [Gammaproteobacteria bacterium 54_18_T64]